MLAVTRRLAIADLIRETGSITVSQVEDRFQVSPMTARRDLAELERQGFARRTHGGAVLPSTAAEEDSFASRVELAADAKAALADAAVAMIGPQETVFLDSSSTAYYVARRVVDRGLPTTLITNSLPIMEMISTRGGPNIRLIGIGGTLRPLTRSFVGPYAVRTVQGHFADRLFLSVKGVTGGVLTDADELEAEVKRSMIAQARESILLVDASKLGARGQNAIADMGDLATALVHGAAPDDLDPVRTPGVVVRSLEA